MAPPEEPQLSARQLADLSALADGSLDAARREAVESWIAGSPPLSDLLERERTAVELLRHSAAGERAPARLRAHVDAQLRPRQPARRRRPAFGRVGIGLAASALGAVVLVLALALPGGAPGSPSVSQAALLALRGPSLPAPRLDPTVPREKLAVQLQDLYFPNWARTLGWRATGLRRDLIGGRLAITVYYRRGSLNVAYTIVAAPALEQPSAPATRMRGLELRALNLAGRTVVTWRRAAHTCVLSAVGVPAVILEQLAAWRDI